MSPVIRALFVSDLVDSTALVASRGDVRAAEILAAHDRIVRDNVVRFGGREIDRTDGFLILFDRPADAIHCALDLHSRLQDGPVGGATLRARVGVHLGEVVLRANDATDVARGAKAIEAEGLAKAITARICGLARSGQTLVSRAVADVARRDAEPLMWSDLGSWDLKGVPRPVDLLEVASAREALRGMPVDGEKARRSFVAGQIPRPSSSLVGRSAEIRDLSERLESTRLVTLSGPAGSGKTRLAIEVGHAVRDQFPGGVWFCDLVEARDAFGVCAGVARSMRIPLVESDPVAQIGSALAARDRTLLLLDNFEQVVGQAAPTVGRWRELAPDLAMLVTSRERLRLSDEVQVEVGPMPTGADEGEDDDAMRLFEERARAIRPGFALDASNREVVAEIVRRVDGLPLAVELAAARIAVLSPSQILKRLDKPLELLTRGRRDDPARQATLREAIRGSWDLLMPCQGAALAQCAVFHGGWTLEAAEAVIDTGAWPDAPPALDLLQDLVDKSLVRVNTDAHGSYRYSMLESVRAFAQECLLRDGAVAGPDGRSVTGEAAAQAVRRRHAAYFISSGAHAESENIEHAAENAGAAGDGALAVDALVAWAEATLRAGPVSAVLGRLVVDADQPGEERARLHWLRARAAGALDAPHEALDEASAGLEALGITRVRLHGENAGAPGKDPGLLSRLGRAWVDAAVRVEVTGPNRPRTARVDWADLSDPAERVAWDLLQAEFAIRGGDPDGAHALLLPLTHEAHPAAVRCRAHRLLAATRAASRVLVDAISHGECALDLAVAERMDEEALDARAFLARIRAEQGSLDPARWELAAVVDRAGLLGLTRVQMSAKVELAAVLAWLGELEAARDLAEQVARQTAEPRVRARSWLVAFECAVGQDDPDAASLHRLAVSCVPRHRSHTDLHAWLDLAERRAALRRDVASIHPRSWPDRTTRALAAVTHALGVSRQIPVRIRDHSVVVWTADARDQTLDMNEGTQFLGAWHQALAEADMVEVLARAGERESAVAHLEAVEARAAGMRVLPRSELARRIREVRAFLDQQ